MDQSQTPTGNQASQNQIPRERPAYLQLALPISILVAAALISGSIFYTRGGATQSGGANIGNNPPASKVDIKVGPDEHTLGDKNAKVTIVEYSDFQCPFCRRFWRETLPELKREYINTGKARFVYRHFPLDFHPAAMPSAKAVECANERGKFWEMHDKIFEEQDKLGQGTIQFTVADIKKWAAQIGLDRGSFDQCLDSDRYNQQVTSDLNSGSQAGVSGTPTVFINGQRVVGAQPYASFKAVIDSLGK